METAVRWALGEPDIGTRHYRPPFFLLAGFSGALLPGRPVGHLLLATEVVDEHDGRWPATWPGDRHVPHERGRALTADALVVDPQAKRELGDRHGAVAVDMESAAAARLCHEHGVPFGCLRAVSDDLDTPLSPELVGLLRDGRPSALAVLSALARRPKVAAELWKLAANTCTAARRLGEALGALLAPAP
jgi:adenosylhomocysteine nucleosidase